MNHASLFSGIGGFDLAAEWVGWNNIFHCDNNPFAQKILKYYWPNAITYEDITKTNFTIHRGRIDVLTGGFPCQGFSNAGKRKGTEDDRYLWPEMFRAIKEIQPSWVVAENVPGIISWSKGMVFEQIQIDLETEGYEVQPLVLPACGKNAPHKRYRVWFVAYSNDNGSYGAKNRQSDNKGNDNNQTGKKSIKQSKRCHSKTNVTNAETMHERVNIGKEETGQTRKLRDRSKSDITADTISIGLRGKGDGIRKTRFFGKESEINDWENFPTQSPVSSGNDGFYSRLDFKTILETIGRKVNKAFKPWRWWRNESIKGYGNAIVPQLALEIFKVIEQIEKT